MNKHNFYPDDPFAEDSSRLEPPTTRADNHTAWRPNPRGVDPRTNPDSIHYDPTYTGNPYDKIMGAPRELPAPRAETPTWWNERNPTSEEICEYVLGNTAPQWFDGADPNSPEIIGLIGEIDSILKPDILPDSSKPQ